MNVAQLPPEVIRQTIAFTFGSVLDVLSLGVVNRQVSDVLRELGESLNEKVMVGSLITDRSAQHFFRWANMSMHGVATAAAGCDSSAADGLVYLCSECRNPILRPADIISSNYHGARGPALLVETLHNTRLVRAPYFTDFATGAYSVCDVVCGRCSLPLAKKYVDASEPLNRFKVGKYLLERTLIYAPRCCNYGASRAALSKRSSDDTEVCARCSQQLEWHVTQAVLLITEQFRPDLCRRLAEALRAEEALVPALARSSSADRSEVVAASGLPWKLSELCSWPGADVHSVLQFVDRVAKALTAAVNNHQAELASEGLACGIVAVRTHDVRWDLLRAAALSCCHDMVGAIMFLSVLSENEQPRLELERLIAVLAKKLRLQGGRIQRLQKAAGLQTANGVCLWNPFALCARVG